MVDSLAHEIARILLDIQAIGFNPTHPVTFKSGIKSPVYVDNRILPFYPSHWKTVLAGFQTLIAGKSIEFDVLAGIEAAGIPHSAALGYAMQKPSVFVRKQPREHGKQKRIEGGDVENKRVLLLEDLVTTGGSSLSGVIALREAGAIAVDCIAIFSYGFDEAISNFVDSGVRLHTLTNFDAVWQVARESNTISQEVIDAVNAWHTAPHEWQTK